MSAVFVVACLALCLGVGAWAGYQWAKSDYLREVRRLEGTIQENVKALKSAQVDVEIVSALRSGDLGVADLQEIGFKDVREEATGALEGAFAGPKALVEALDETQCEYQPFTPLPYKRDITSLSDMTPGDEAWISVTAVQHNTVGEPTLWDNTVCSSDPTGIFRCRIRRFGDGTFEIAFDPDDPKKASGVVAAGSYKMEHVTVLRPEDRYRA